MAEQSRAGTALAEDLSSVCSPHNRWLTPPESSVLGGSELSGLHRHTCNKLTLKTIRSKLGTVVHIFGLGTWEAETNGSLEFEVSLVYIVNSRQPELSQKNKQQTNN